MIRKTAIHLCALTLFTVVSGTHADSLPSVAQEVKITHSKARQSKEATFNAERWQMSIQEWTRYEQLMQGPRGRWSPNLDPLIVLGIHAENDQQRMRYAEMQVRVEYERITQELAFQKAFRTAFARLYPDLLPIMNQRLAHTEGLITASQTRNTRILYFPTVDCTSCKLTITRLVNLLKDHRVQGVDIYLLDAKTEDEVRQWASKQQIPLAWIQTGRLSLNLDQGVFNQLTQTRKPSELFERTGEDIRVLDRQQYGL